MSRSSRHSREMPLARNLDVLHRGGLDMEYLFPLGIVLFGLLVELWLTKSDATWSARMNEMDRRNAEVVERLHAKRQKQ